MVPSLSRSCLSLASLPFSPSTGATCPLLFYFLTVSSLPHSPPFPAKPEYLGIISKRRNSSHDPSGDRVSLLVKSTREPFGELPSSKTTVARNILFLQRSRTFDRCPRDLVCDSIPRHWTKLNYPFARPLLFTNAAKRSFSNRSLRSKGIASPVHTSSPWREKWCYTSWWCWATVA